MSISLGPKPTVTKGLIVHLDARNISSYSGSGNVWYDISGNGANAKVISYDETPIYNSFGGGSMRWDTYSDKANVISSNATKVLPNKTSLSAFAWAYNTGWSPWGTGTYVSFTHTNTNPGFPPYPNIFSLGYVSGGVNKLYYVISTSTNMYNGTAYDNANSLNTVLSINTWYYVGFTWDGTSLKGYVNGTLDGTVNAPAVKINTPVNNGGLLIGQNTMFFPGGDENQQSNGGDGIINGYISTVQIYDRAISIAEIQQNYNNMKYRFGL